MARLRLVGVAFWPHLAFVYPLGLRIRSSLWIPIGFSHWFLLKLSGQLRSLASHFGPTFCPSVRPSVCSCVCMSGRLVLAGSGSECGS